MLQLERIRSLILHALAVVAVGLPASQVMAQAAPMPSLTRTPQAWVGYGIVFVLFVAVVAVSLMPSKRSHQE